MPVIYSNSNSGGSGSVNIPEVHSDPVSPTPESAWVLATKIATQGSPIGLLISLTYATDVYTYEFSYQTLEGSIVRTTLG